MTGMLIVIAAVALLIAALAPAHRRAGTWQPGADLVSDRDHQRHTDELTAVAQRQVRGPRRVARLLGAAGSAVPLHRSARLTSH